MQFDQARELDRALLALHADLAERLPPGPAQRRELVVYLNTLIDWLNTDP
jgi:hypothetical protein